MGACLAELVGAAGGEREPRPVAREHRDEREIADDRDDGGGKRAQKKQTVIDRLKGFFEKYFGLGVEQF